MCRTNDASEHKNVSTARRARHYCRVLERAARRHRRVSLKNLRIERKITKCKTAIVRTEGRPGTPGTSWTCMGIVMGTESIIVYLDHSMPPSRRRSWVLPRWELLGSSRLSIVPLIRECRVTDFVVILSETCKTFGMIFKMA
ncbi:hypothetical protein EVAR_36622_1 [Eumeta japonica]|uniref:Uncharacterized protein n=1 Tax=Eumeta variegata TaxID=151549 RepID=A0A4C1ZXP0_EUMVA|nr:hypothetical protein EVAR_36622_1 [Eumeta japonica]